MTAPWTPWRELPAADLQRADAAAGPAALPPLSEDRLGLLAWAARERSQDFADHLEAAMSGADIAGWDWRRTAGMACRLILGGDPSEMTDAVRTFRRHEYQPPANPHAWADKARRDLARAANQDGAPPE